MSLPSSVDITPQLQMISKKIEELFARLDRLEACMHKDKGKAGDSDDVDSDDGDSDDGEAKRGEGVDEVGGGVGEIEEGVEEVGEGVEGGDEYDYDGSLIYDSIADEKFWYDRHNEERRASQGSRDDEKECCDKRKEEQRAPQVNRDNLIWYSPTEPHRNDGVVSNEDAVPYDH